MAFGLGVAAVGGVFLAGAHELGQQILGGTFALGGLIFAGGGARVLIAHSAFKRADLVGDSGVKLGGTATVSLELVSARPLTFGPKSKLVLECIEEAVYSAGSSSRTYRDTLHTETLPLELPPTLDGVFSKEVTLKIPEHVAPTWSGSHNRFYTKVTAHLDLEKWPDLQLEARVHVLAEVAS